MIKHNPRLSLKDRYRLIKRVLKLALDKDSKYVNLLWQTPEGSEQTHTFYAEGTDPTEPFLTYMATVAGKSKTLEAMNDRAHYYLSKTAVAFTKLHGLELDDYCYVAQPIRKKPASIVGAEIPLKRLCDDNVLLTGKTSGGLYTLEIDDDFNAINLVQDEIGAGMFPIDATIKYLGDDVWLLENKKYYIKSKQPYYPA